jgi:hypothetical protein
MFLHIHRWSNSLEVQDVVIVSCFVGYNETSKAYMIYIPTQWKTMVSQDVKFDEDVWSSRSHRYLLQ